MFPEHVVVAVLCVDPGGRGTQHLHQTISGQQKLGISSMSVYSFSIL